jgi:hypothetical protein
VLTAKDIRHDQRPAAGEQQPVEGDGAGAALEPERTRDLGGRPRRRFFGRG